MQAASNRSQPSGSSSSCAGAGLFRRPSHRACAAVRVPSVADESLSGLSLAVAMAVRVDAAVGGPQS